MPSSFPQSSEEVHVRIRDHSTPKAILLQVLCGPICKSEGQKLGIRIGLGHLVYMHPLILKVMSNRRHGLMKSF